mmetsp:Transcript_24590/g.72834  ORF Transcript_24590/g.72834 Transcript_24590/m.72834 type:complete len:372 (-) Transcript_24590:156-1271(-)
MVHLARHHRVQMRRHEVPAPRAQRVGRARRDRLCLGQPHLRVERRSWLARAPRQRSQDRVGARVASLQLLQTSPCERRVALLHQPHHLLVLQAPLEIRQAARLAQHPLHTQPHRPRQAQRPPTLLAAQRLPQRAEHLVGREVGAAERQRGQHVGRPQGYRLAGARAAAAVSAAVAGSMHVCAQLSSATLERCERLGHRLHRFVARRTVTHHIWHARRLHASIRRSARWAAVFVPRRQRAQVNAQRRHLDSNVGHRRQQRATLLHRKRHDSSQQALARPAVQRRLNRRCVVRAIASAAAASIGTPSPQQLRQLGRQRGARRLLRQHVRHAQQLPHGCHQVGHLLLQRRQPCRHIAATASAARAAAAGGTALG